MSKIKIICFLFLFSGFILFSACSDSEDTTSSPQSEEQEGGMMEEQEEEMASNDEMQREEMESSNDSESNWSCDQEAIQIENDMIAILEYPLFVAYDYSDGKEARLIVEMPNVVGPGSYDLTGMTPDTCDELCVFLYRNCTASAGCQLPFMAVEGQVEVLEYSNPGEPLKIKAKELEFKGIDRTTNTIREIPYRVCQSQVEIDRYLPAEIDDVVPDFALQNCETEEWVSLHDLGANTQVMWLIGTAGWCPACRQLLRRLFDEVYPQYESTQLQPMLILSEDDNYQVPTLEYCRQYAQSYADDARNFYLDPNLQKTQSHLRLFYDQRGNFSLPWKTLIQGQSFEYRYSDGVGLNFETIFRDLLTP